MIGYGLAKKRLRYTFVRYKFGEERPLQTGDIMIGSFRTCGKNGVYKRPHCHTPDVLETPALGHSLVGSMQNETQVSLSCFYIFAGSYMSYKLTHISYIITCKI